MQVESTVRTSQVHAAQVRSAQARPRGARRWLAAGAVFASAGLVVALAGCAAGKPDVVPSDADASPVVQVRAIDNAFEPSEVTIKPGEAVEWVFEGVSAEHDVVAEDGSFVSDLMYTGSYIHVFDEAGSYPYDCSLHPEMVGIVHVEG